MKLLDGKLIADQIKDELAREVRENFIDKGMSEEDKEEAAQRPAEPIKTIDHQAAATVDKAADARKV